MNPDQCAWLRHPGVTYNPWHDCTWCACGHACYPGDHARHGIVCCTGERKPTGRPADPHQQEADRRRVAAFLAGRRAA